MAEMGETTVVVLQSRRGPGRPRAIEPGSALTAWVPQSYHDRISQLALKHDVSVSKVVCRLLDQALRPTRNGQ